MGAEHAGAARVAGGRAGAGADRAGGGGECEGWGPRARRAWAFQRASAPGELYSQEARSLLGYAWEQGQVRREGLGAGGRGCACLPSAQPCCWQQRQLMCLSTACVAVANSHSRKGGEHRRRGSGTLPSFSPPPPADRSSTQATPRARS